jgi:hypothetical protein
MVKTLWARAIAILFWRGSESRLQRLACAPINSWGDAPRLG